MNLSSLVEQDRFARAAWCRIAEPEDPLAHRLIAELGASIALHAVAERTEPVLDMFRRRLTGLDLEADLAVAHRVQARLVCPKDPEWPDGLNDLTHPPYCLWVRGPLTLQASCTRSVAVVGARAATGYGEQQAAQLRSGLAARGFTVVSGAAFGVDAAAHRGTLADSGPTIAVLAGGVDRAYPAAHDALLRHIAATGAVVSEAAPAAAPRKSRFLQRNRIIATMTRGVVVVEAGLRSGARHTARLAADHQRVVSAFPGPVTSPMSAGCHEMIRSGMATLVTDAAEVAELAGELGTDLAASRTGPVRAEDELAEHDRQVLDVLPRRHGLSVEQVSVQAGLSVPATLACLGRLQLAGLVRYGEDGWLSRPVTARRTT